MIRAHQHGIDIARVEPCEHRAAVRQLGRGHAGNAARIAADARIADEQAPSVPGMIVELAPVIERGLDEPLARACRAGGYEAAVDRGDQVGRGFPAPVRGLRADRGIALGGLLAVEFADISTRADCGADHAADMGIAFRLIGGEDRLVRIVIGDRGHLPGEIGDVAQPVTHPLSEEGGRLVRGIAGQEHPPDLPLFRHQPVEAIGRRAHDRVRYVLHPRADQPADRFGLRHDGIVLAGKQHEFPAAVIPAPGHDRRGPIGIAHHDRETLEIGAFRHPLDRRKGDGPFDLGIDHQPRLLEIEIVELHAERLAHRAARAVARDHPADAHFVVDGAIGIGQRDAGCVLPQPGEFRAETQIDPAILRKRLTQMRLEFGLIEEIVVGPSERAGLAHRAHIADDAMVGPDMEVPVGRDHVARDPVDHPGGLEQPHHLVVEMHRAGQGVMFEFLFQHDDRQPLAPQQIGRHRTHGAAAHDRDIEARAGHQATGAL